MRKTIMSGICAVTFMCMPCLGQQCTPFAITAPLTQYSTGGTFDAVLIDSVTGDQIAGLQIFNPTDVGLGTFTMYDGVTDWNVCGGTAYALGNTFGIQGSSIGEYLDNWNAYYGVNVIIYVGNEVLRDYSQLEIGDVLTFCCGDAPPPGCDGGAEIDATCPCDDDWKNHGHYMLCVTLKANELLDAGLVDENCHGELVSSRAKSDCGKKNK